MISRHISRLMFLVLMLVGSSAIADVVSSSGHSPYWQNIPVNTRAMGMGGAFIGVLEGPDAARWSPAVPFHGNGIAVSWNQDSERKFAPLTRWTGALSYEHNGMRMSLIHDSVANGPHESVYLPASNTVYDTTDLMSLSGDITSLLFPDRSRLVTFGIGLRRTQYDSGVYKGEFMGLDFGLTAGQSWVETNGASTSWQIGAALINGVRPTSDDGMSPESNLRVGGAWEVGMGSGLFGGHAFSFLAAYDWSKTNSEVRSTTRQWEQRAGAEAMLWNIVALRIGVIDRGTNLLVGDKTWGIGIVVEDPKRGVRVRVEYARERIEEHVYWDEEIVERVGVGVSLGMGG